MVVTVIKAESSQQFNSLVSLGLKAEWLTEVCVKALTAYNQTTPFDAANAAGSFAYFAAVRAIREILCPNGWKILRSHNLELTRNPVAKVRIVVSSGDKDTGIENGIPRTKNPKGRQTRKIVTQNAKQMKLWPHLEPKVIDDQSESTWILLYHFDAIGSEMRMELSLPVEMDLDELRVTQWSKRIILSPVAFDIPIALPPEFDPDDGPEITIRRRKDGE